MSEKNVTLAWRILLVVAVMISGLLSLAGWPARAQDVLTTETPLVALQATETPTVTPTATPTATNTPTPTDTPTATPTWTPSNTPVPQLIVTGVEPAFITSGQESTLSVFGANFTESTTVRLIGVGLLQTTFVNSTALRAIVPASIAPGGYSVQVSDPITGTAFAGTIITVIAPPPTLGPTFEPPPTLAPTEPPTPVPGQPSLIVGNFSATPDIIAPGDTVTLTFQVVNQGNRTAQGVSVTIADGSKYVAANGQASIALPDIASGGRTMVAMTVIVPLDAVAGPTTVPVTMSYRDFSGQTYTSNGQIGISVVTEAESSQVVVTSYAITPNPVIPGQPVTVTISVMNTGNEVANQVLMRLAGSENVLLAGPEGDSFALGDLMPGATVTRELTMVVSAGAEAGPQSQPITLTFLQAEEAASVESSMTVNVAAVNAPKPLLLLTSYGIGSETLRPGQQFTLSFDLQNMGNAPVSQLLVTFGTVDGGSDSGSGSGGSSTTPSNIFAPLGTGGTIFIDRIEANGGTISLEQDFIVSGTAASGIYTLPVTLRYQNAANEAVRDQLGASLVVIAPPLLQISLQGEIPPTVNAGEPLFVGLQITNTGEKTVNLTVANVEAENADVVEGAEVLLGSLPKGEDVSINGTVIPIEEGPVTVTVTIHYRDELSQERTIVQTYEVEAFAPPPPPDVEEPFPGEGGFPTPESTEEPDDNLAGRIIMGLFGLGS